MPIQLNTTFGDYAAQHQGAIQYQDGKPSLKLTYLFYLEWLKTEQTYELPAYILLNQVAMMHQVIVELEAHPEKQIKAIIKSLQNDASFKLVQGSVLKVINTFSDELPLQTPTVQPPPSNQNKLKWTAGLSVLGTALPFVLGWQGISGGLLFAAAIIAMVSFVVLVASVCGLVGNYMSKPEKVKKNLSEEQISSLTHRLEEKIAYNSHDSEDLTTSISDTVSGLRFKPITIPELGSTNIDKPVNLVTLAEKLKQGG